jgi:antitoxin YefM
MENMTYSDFRHHLATALDRVNENHTPILVTRQSGKAVVVISLEDFRSYEKTAPLTFSSENAERLNQAFEKLEIDELENEGGLVKNLNKK